MKSSRPSPARPGPAAPFVWFVLLFSPPKLHLHECAVFYEPVRTPGPQPEEKKQKTEEKEGRRGFSFLLTGRSRSSSSLRLSRLAQREALYVSGRRSALLHKAGLSDAVLKRTCQSSRAELRSGGGRGATGRSASGVLWQGNEEEMRVFKVR